MDADADVDVDGCTLLYSTFARVCVMVRYGVLVTFRLLVFVVLFPPLLSAFLQVIALLVSCLSCPVMLCLLFALCSLLVARCSLDFALPFFPSLPLCLVSVSGLASTDGVLFIFAVCCLLLPIWCFLFPRSPFPIPLFPLRAIPPFPRFPPFSFPIFQFSNFPIFRVIFFIFETFTR